MLEKAPKAIHPFISVEAKMNLPRAIYIGLGGNVGNTSETFQKALALVASKGLQKRRLSPLYKTKAVGGVAQPDFVNAVAEFITDLRPDTVYTLLQEVEALLGRNRLEEVRWGPRTLDLDYLIDETFTSYESPTLTLPHPRMWERAFVLCPLSDLLPDLLVSNGDKISVRAQELAIVQGVVRA